MAIWSDIADWIGPCPNKTAGGMGSVYGVVLHIQDGNQQGSISWFRNPSSGVSSHFLVPKTGRAVQIVDTADKAWCQKAGNTNWLSVENEGHTGDVLTPSQVEQCAKILARAHRDYGVPLQQTDSTSGRGLGWHGMGGAAWGNHTSCPGAPIVAQRGDIIGQAEKIISGQEGIAVADVEEIYRQLKGIRYIVDRIVDCTGYPGVEGLTFHQNGQLFNAASLFVDGRKPYGGQADPSADDPQSYIDRRIQLILDSVRSSSVALSDVQVAELSRVLSESVTSQLSALTSQVSRMADVSTALREAIVAAGAAAGS